MRRNFVRLTNGRTSTSLRAVLEGDQALVAVKATLERSETCGLIKCVHDVESHLWEGFSPSLLVASDGKSDTLNNCLVRLLACAVSLQVVAGSSGQFQLYTC